MASSHVYTIVPNNDVTLDELKEAFRPIIINNMKDGVLERDSTYPDTEDELFDCVTKGKAHRGERFGLVSMRWLYDIQSTINEATRKHPDLINGLIRVGAETTRGSMNARMIDVDENGNQETVDRESHDSYPLGGHKYSFRGVIGINPEL